MQVSEKKTFNLLRSSVTHLEDFCNEIFYEIFEFLDFYHIYEAFSKLNSRFTNLVNGSNISIRFNLSKTSKSAFQHHYEHMIIRNEYRIKLLYISNPLIIDYVFSSSILSKLIHLENLNLHNIHSKYIEELLMYLICMPNLSSLTINCPNNLTNKNFIFQQIFLLPVLKYCKLSFEETDKSDSLSVATTKHSSIEQLTIIGKVNVNEFITILSYIPQIRRLSVSNIYESSKYQTKKFNPIVLNHLTHVYLNMKDVNFDNFESIIKNMSHQIQVLYISTKNDELFTTANHWQELIVSHLPNLRIFDIQHRYSSHKMNHLTYNDFFKQQNFSFWFQRKWFFNYDIYNHEGENQIIIYSTNPYRYE
ncbi:unnamed protein product [Rotaria sp. Silwood2]|nr:unnamed protein product [Rotaria sp. Silwood2]